MKGWIPFNTHDFLCAFHDIERIFSRKNACWALHWLLLTMPTWSIYKKRYTRKHEKKDWDWNITMCHKEVLSLVSWQDQDAN